ncbi:MAG: hypothetical protein KME06_01515 [Kastovskya adunca ATA6-11-RM4]|nr:hypothetical protein [Kastovskya adunca ATA6-11-RM4]
MHNLRLCSSQVQIAHSNRRGIQAHPAQRLVFSPHANTTSDRRSTTFDLLFATDHYLDETI